MNHRASASVALLAATLVLGGCKEESVPDYAGTGDDRTLQKLRQEVDRVNQGGRPSQGPEATRGDPNANLAGLAAGINDAPTERTWELPSPNDSARLETLSVKLTGMEASHSVKGSGKVSLTSEDLFFRVQLLTQNLGGAPLTLDLDGAKLFGDEGQSYAVARDAQSIGGTRPLRRTWAPDERTDVVLLFELPPEALRDDGLHLLLQGSGGDVRIPLK